MLPRWPYPGRDPSQANQQAPIHPTTYVIICGPHLVGRSHQLQLLDNAQRGIQLQHHPRGSNAPVALPAVQLLHRQHACREPEAQWWEMTDQGNIASDVRKWCQLHCYRVVNVNACTHPPRKQGMPAPVLGGASGPHTVARQCMCSGEYLSIL